MKFNYFSFSIRKWFSLQRIIKVSTLLFLSQNINAQSFSLNCTIPGKDSGYATLSYFRDAFKQRRSDTVAIKQGKFKFDGKVTGAEFAMLKIDNSYGYKDKKYSADFFIEPGVLNIAFNEEEVIRTIIKGSKIQREYEALLKYTSKESVELKRLSASYNLIRSQLKNGIIDPKTSEEKIKEIDKINNPIYLSKSNKELAYIKKHPNSYVSLLLLHTFVGILPNDSIDLMYSTLSNRVKGSSLDYRFLDYNSKYRKAIAEEYPFDKLMMNEPAPPFVINNTITGDSLNVSNFKGQVVLLDFWSLYCLPCLKANPYIEDIRKKHGNDNFKIISVANTQLSDMPELISYTTKNKFLDWIHVSTNKEVMQTSNLILTGNFSNYEGLGVPRTVLINKSGNVVYKNYGYTPEDMQKLKILIDKVVNETDTNIFH